jgi:two-component system heavy metal sensor histidine kinase CusS
VLILAAVLCPRLALSIARWSTRSLREVSDTARRISSTTLSKRIQVQDYPREIAIMAESFNSMLNRLEDSFLRLSRFSADLAHELRTPVNNIRGESEVALARTRSPEEYRDALGSCLEESVRLSELIESLLFLARSENPGKHLRKQPCNIATLLSSVCEYYEASASEAGVTLSLKCSDGVDIQADPALLQRAIGNLVSNSLANTSPGGAVNLTGRRQQQEFYIVVKDTGKGIPSDDLPKVFDRFFRSDPSRTRGSGGSGLGLAIVRQIIQLHGGDVKIESQVGIGTSISVVLPLQN